MAEKTSDSKTFRRFSDLLISNLAFTGKVLGKGSYATVNEVEWNGTVSAAKRLHEILLEDESPGGTDKLISNFEAECLTWSKLRHPGVVQFFGVYMEPKSRLPVLVMEKMDTTLRKYTEDHSKEEFPLHQKTFVLRQVAQALAYLHSQNPPLVHHDLSPNNVLLNMVSFVAKISDFGMSRAINPSALSRKSSIKGTPAFMPPEALQKVPKYDTKLDVFSFGNVIIFTLTHEWPDPEAPTKYEGGQLIALSELQRREYCTEQFTAQEKQLFLPTVRRCLEHQPDKRPSSALLVQDLRRIESDLPVDGHVATPIEHLHRQLSAKEEECKLKDKALREKDEALRKAMHPLRDWRKLGKCEKVIQHKPGGGGYGGVAVNGEGLLAVTDDDHECVHLLNNEGLLVRSIGEGQLDDVLSDVAFDLKGNIWVTDHKSSKAIKLSQDGQLEQTIRNASSDSDCLSFPFGITVSPEGLIYICDSGNHRVTVHDEDGKFLFTFGSEGSGPGCFNKPRGVACGSDGLVYVTDQVNERVCVWSKQGQFVSCFKTEHRPYFAAATSDNHLLVTSRYSDAVMVYTLEGRLIHQFGGRGNDEGKFREPQGICIGSNGLVYVGDCNRKRIQVFASVM